MGRPGINTALIPPVPRTDLSRGDRRNAFNAGVPSDDVRDFFDDMVAVLTNPNGPYQRTAADATGLASFLLPDILTYDSSAAARRPNAYLLSTAKAIQFFQERVGRDPQDCVNQTLLGEMYIRKARETGHFASYEQAETAIQTALKLDPTYLPAQVDRAILLSAKHR